MADSALGNVGAGVSAEIGADAGDGAEIGDPSITSQLLSPVVKRPTVLRGRTFKFNTQCGNLFITVNDHPSEPRPVEVFAAMGKAGGCSASHLESVARLVSVMLRSGVPMTPVVEMLQGMSCGNGAFNYGHFTKSCSDAFSMALRMAHQPHHQTGSITGSTTS